MGGEQVRAEGGCDCRLRLFAYFIQKSESNQACVDARDAKGENGNAMDAKGENGNARDAKGENGNAMDAKGENGNARDAKGENDNACDFFIGVCVNERAKRAGALNLSRAANSFIDILRV